MEKDGSQIPRANYALMFGIFQVKGIKIKLKNG